MVDLLENLTTCLGTGIVLQASSSVSFALDSEAHQTSQNYSTAAQRMTTPVDCGMVILLSLYMCPTLPAPLPTRYNDYLYIPYLQGTISLKTILNTPLPTGYNLYIP